MRANYPHQTLFDLPFFDGSDHDLLLYLRQRLEKKSGLITVATPNPEQIVQAFENSDFQETLKTFDVFLPDGAGVVWASRILGRPLQERIAGVDVVAELLQIAKELKLKVLLVGGRKLEVAGDERKEVRGQGNASQLSTPSSLSPDLRPLNINVKDVAVEWIEGYQGISNMKESELGTADELVNQVIEKIKPDVIFVALGAPYQEKWVVRNRKVLEKNTVSLAMVVGGAIDFLTGKVSRAPQWVQQFGLEWLYRLIQEPWRWKRQLRLFTFIGLVVREIFRNKK